MSSAPAGVERGTTRWPPNPSLLACPPPPPQVAEELVQLHAASGGLAWQGAWLNGVPLQSVCTGELGAWLQSVLAACTVELGARLQPACTGGLLKAARGWSAQLRAVFGCRAGGVADEEPLHACSLHAQVCVHGAYVPASTTHSRSPPLPPALQLNPRTQGRQAKQRPKQQQQHHHLHPPGAARPLPLPQKGGSPVRLEVAAAALPAAAAAAAAA